MSTDPEQTQYEFTQDQFERVRTLLYEHSGIKLNNSRFIVD